MRRSISRTSLLVFLLVAAGASTATLALESYERTITLEASDDNGSISIENLLGSVHVVPAGEPGAVRVTARVVAEAKTEPEARALADAIRIDQVATDGELRYLVAFPTDRHAFRPPKSGMTGLIRRWTAPMFHETAAVRYDGRAVQVTADRKAAGLAVHLVVEVPYDRSITVRQRVGPVEARALRGELRIESVDGLVAVERCLGSLEVETVRGDVHVAAFQGDELRLRSKLGKIELLDIRVARSQLETESGSIRGDNVRSDELTVASATGDVEFGSVEPKTVEVKTGSGRVDLASNLQSLNDAVIESDSGDVTLRIGELTHFDLDVETKSGSVKTLGGLSLDLQEQEGLSSRLQYGQGGPHLRISALGGSVTVRPFDGSRLNLLLRD